MPPYTNNSLGNELSEVHLQPIVSLNLTPNATEGVDHQSKLGLGGGGGVERLCS